jgi:hypothetical protein
MPRHNAKSVYIDSVNDMSKHGLEFIESVKNNFRKTRNSKLDKNQRNLWYCDFSWLLNCCQTEKSYVHFEQNFNYYSLSCTMWSWPLSLLWLWWWDNVPNIHRLMRLAQWQMRKFSRMKPRTPRLWVFSMGRTTFSSKHWNFKILLFHEKIVNFIYHIYLYKFFREICVNVDYMPLYYFYELHKFVPSRAEINLQNM